MSHDYKRLVAIVVLLVVFGIHVLKPEALKLDWPGVALLGAAVVLFLVPKLELLLPFVKSLKVGKAEIELRERVTALAVSVALSEQNPPETISDRSAELLLAGAKYERLVNTTTEAEIVNIAVKDKKAGLIRLGLEIESEILQLHGSAGLRNESKAHTTRDYLEELARHKTVMNPSDLNIWGLGKLYSFPS